MKLGFITTSLVVGVICLLIIIIMFIVSKNNKKKKIINDYKRKVLIKELIKTYLFNTQNLKNLEINNLKIVLNKTKQELKTEYYICLFKFCDVQKKTLEQQLAIEVVGKNNSNKKNKSEITWKILQELDSNEAEMLIKINEKKIYKTKLDKVLIKEYKLSQNLKKIEELKYENKQNLNSNNPEILTRKKFIPKRKNKKKRT